MISVFQELSSPRARFFRAAAMIVAVFCIDVLTPLGIADWALYLIPLLYVYPALDRRLFHLFFSACIALTLVGIFLSPSGVPFFYYFFNRAMGVFVLSATMVILSDNKRCAEARCASEKKYRSLIETARDAIFIADAAAGVVLEANKQAEQLLGLSAGKITGLQQAHLSSAGQPDDVTALLAECVRCGGGLIKDRLVRHADGHAVPVDIYASITEAEGKKIVQCIFYDATERKRGEEQKRHLEQQLMQAQKMESIGQLAGGVAHDFNNVLTTIQGYASLLPAVLHEPDQSKKYLEEIVRGCERAADLTRSLLAFSRKQSREPRPVDLNDIVAGIERMLRRLIGENIELKTSLVEGPLPLLADRTQMEQVIVNLSTNARDSMPRGGTLTIGTKVFCPGTLCIKDFPCAEAGAYAVLSVSDTGEGMDEETKERIFEPFFTTKELGKGTGLGLSIVYGIVKQHDGCINVSSEPGKGTTFSIYLPLLSQEAGGGEAQGAPALPRSGSETILVAEDEEVVRMVLREILESYGYEVLEATDGEEAVRSFTENRGRIHLVLLDVMMPKKNGKEAFEEIRAAAPDTKVLFMSGYTADIVGCNGGIDTRHAFLSKPIDPDTLLEKIRSALDGVCP
ncbi:MAG: ATP-binding protein [Thermodesulfovibrionales bacterium]